MEEKIRPLKIGVVTKDFEEWKLFTSSNVVFLSTLTEYEAVDEDSNRYLRYNGLDSTKGVRLDQLLFIGGLENITTEHWLILESMLWNSVVPKEFQILTIDL